MDRYYGHKVTFDYATRKFMRDYEQLLPRYRKQFEAAAERAASTGASSPLSRKNWNPGSRLAEGRAGRRAHAHARDGGADGHRESHGREPSIVGGSKYLWRMKRRIAKLSTDIPEQDLNWMALAAYNMGFGHLLDARQVTKANGREIRTGGST